MEVSEQDLHERERERERRIVLLSWKNCCLRTSSKDVATVVLHFDMRHRDEGDVRERERDPINQ